ncbi:MAG: SUMF1/EgtB/PvdO family nonheme iron enzyme [Paludibacteraceae bacterium]|nr:SUMF1/EgtB/PvdO family nonheme iron enzyme [Paludibacteraceae bacterium]
MLITLPTGQSFTMIYVEGGSFVMGCTSEQSDCISDERPAHRVTVNSYYIGETEVTQELWSAVMGRNPSYYTGSQRPVEQVSWNDCQKFINKLNQLTGRKFRLPTEAEWEYAARGGKKSKAYKYSGSNTLDNVAWYTNNSGNQTHNVKTKFPNELGIYDMSGNVREWCQDWYGSGYYANSPQANPTGPSSGFYRVLRGGSWLSFAQNCRVARRSSNTPSLSSGNVGFRLILVQ